MLYRLNQNDNVRCTNSQHQGPLESTTCRLGYSVHCSCVPYVPTSALTKVNLFQRDPTSQISYAPPRKSPVLASLLDDRRLKYSRSDVTGFAASACNVITIPHVSINGRGSFNCYRLEGASVAEAVVPPRRVSRVYRMQVGQWLSAPRTIRLLLLPCLHR